MFRPRFIPPLICLLAMLTATHAVTRSAAAQNAGGLTLTLSVNTSKAKIGTIVQFTARVENIGTETIPGLFVFINLPDALNARGMNCPGGTSDQVVTCNIGDFAPGSIAEILYFVEVGNREPNGPVTATAFNAEGTLATAELPALKIVGPRR